MLSASGSFFNSFPCITVKTIWIQFNGAYIFFPFQTFKPTLEFKRPSVNSPSLYPRGEKKINFPGFLKLFFGFHSSQGQAEKKKKKIYFQL